MTSAPQNNNEFTQWHEVLLKFLKWAITSGNVWLLKITKGRVGNQFLGVPVLLLTTTGRKSGEPRTIPLYYMAYDEKVVLVASNGGTSSDPAWLLNVRANPNVTIAIKGEHRDMRAHLASDEEKTELWPHLTTLFPKWQMMEDRSKRSFPVIVLEDPSA